MRMTIIVEVNAKEEGESHDDITMLLIEGGGFYIEQKGGTTISVTNKKQAKALVMGIEALIAASGWK